MEVVGPAEEAVGHRSEDLGPSAHFASNEMHDLKLVTFLP